MTLKLYGGVPPWTVKETLDEAVQLGTVTMVDTFAGLVLTVSVVATGGVGGVGGAVVPT